MSQLFRAMQEVGIEPVQRQSQSTMLAEFFNSVSGEEAAPVEVSGASLQDCRRIILPRMERPILVPTDEDTTTHRAFESYRSIRTKLTRFQATQGIHSVAISSTGPNEGKTVSALNLGMSMAQLETQRVLLIDGDIRTAGLSKLTGTTGTLGLAEVLAGQASFEEAMVATNIPRLFTVGAGELVSPAPDLFAGAKWKEFVGWCSQLFDTVIVDCPPILGLADFDLITAACDGVLMVVRARRTAREALGETVQHLQGKKLLGVILNGMERRHPDSYGYHYYSRGRKK
jgi:capsular exopolysaccharide synthesis family protein